MSRRFLQRKEPDCPAIILFRCAKRNDLELAEILTDEAKSASKGDHILTGNLGKFLLRADTNTAIMPFSLSIWTGSHGWESRKPLS